MLGLFFLKIYVVRRFFGGLLWRGGERLAEGVYEPFYALSPFLQRKQVDIL